MSDLRFGLGRHSWQQVSWEAGPPTRTVARCDHCAEEADYPLPRRGCRGWAPAAFQWLLLLVLACWVASAVQAF